MWLSMCNLTSLSLTCMELEENSPATHSPASRPIFPPLSLSAPPPERCDCWLRASSQIIWKGGLLTRSHSINIDEIKVFLHHINHHFDPHWLVFQVHYDPNIDHLQVCQGTCLCSPSTEGYGKGKVLYCYGEVVYFLNRISWILLSPPFPHNRE